MEEISVNKKAWIVFTVYVRVMFFAFTGGNVTLSLLQKEFDDHYGLMTKDQVLTYFALSQTLPGVISLHAGIMIGKDIAGIRGIIAAFAGIVLTAFCGMIFITVFFQQLRKVSWIQGAINGIRVASIAIIFFNAVTIIKSSVKNRFGIVITMAAFLGSFFFHGSIMLIIIGCGLAGILYNILKKDGGSV